MISSPAYLLVSHGSRDPRPQIAVERLAYLVRQHLENRQLVAAKSRLPLRGSQQERPKALALLDKPSSLLIETATLELATVPLSERIIAFAQKAQSLGIKQVKIVPLFLLPGVHVCQDIPQEVAIARSEIPADLHLELCPYLGSYGRLSTLLARQLSHTPTEATILVSHGTRHVGGNYPVKVLATQLDALAAFWSAFPGLEEQVSNLVTVGKKRIAILPYFLFTGGITDAIAQQVQRLQCAYPHVKLRLGIPLGATPELAHLIVEAIAK